MPRLGNGAGSGTLISVRFDAFPVVLDTARFGMDAHRIQMLILDVDGVLTDGRLWADSDGNGTAAQALQPRAFHVQDGFAIKLWQRCRGKVAILSGRQSSIVEARARQLGISWCSTGSEDKVRSYEELLSAAELRDDAVAYVGDDLPDVGPMMRCAFPVAVRNAVPGVKQIAGYVTRRRGGEGAVAEVVELLLRKQNRWTPNQWVNGRLS